MIAARDEDDENHAASRDIVAGIDRGTLPKASVTTFVVAEVLNLLHGRYKHQLATDMQERLTRGAGFCVVHTTESDFERGCELFQIYDGLSFVDAVLAAYMNRTGIKYLYSLDDDFDALDSITRLRTAANPFAP